jgi:hypothetical protein
VKAIVTSSLSVVSLEHLRGLAAMDARDLTDHTRE